MIIWFKVESNKNISIYNDIWNNTSICIRKLYDCNTILLFIIYYYSIIQYTTIKRIFCIFVFQRNVLLYLQNETWTYYFRLYSLVLSSFAVLILLIFQPSEISYYYFLFSKIFTYLKLLSQNCVKQKFL